MPIKVRKEIVKTDFLIVGGGSAGMQAAIAAAEAGCDVLIAEKADTRRSGSGANGNDHFCCYIPECHGDDFEKVVRQIDMTMDGGPYQDPTMLRLWISRSFEVVQKWEAIGINMRPTGKWNFEGHSVPGNMRYHLKYDGSNQKMLLTKDAKDKGAKIMNKVVVNELLMDQGRVVGAIGIDISKKEPEVVIFQAKAVLLATGGASRLYPGITPQYMFNDCGCPANTGAMHAMALRSGIKVANLEMAAGHAGPRYFARGGKGTWIGLTSDLAGECVTPYQDKPSRENGDITIDIWPGSYRDRMAAGQGPTFMNCTRTTDEDLDYMLHTAMVSEGIDSITDMFEQRHVDLTKEMVEFGSYNIGIGTQGIDIDVHAASNVPGVYAAGSVGNVHGSLAGAVVIGMVAGESAAEYVKTVEEVSVENHPKIAERIALYNSFMDREGGAYWKEAAATLQNIMNDYAGTGLRSEALFTAGLHYLATLRKEALENLYAKNSHELMRVLETLDLMDVGEALMIMANNRKETRGMHKRVDYTYTNMLLNGKFQLIQRVGDEYQMEFRSPF